MCGHHRRRWTVEDAFRTIRSILAARSLYRKRDHPGHVVCSFLALLQRAEFEDRLVRKGHGDVESAEGILDLDR